MKSQAVRLIDVFALGPFLLWAAPQLRPRWVRNTMVLAGLLTMLYNGGNYLRVQRGQSHDAF